MKYFKFKTGKVVHSDKCSHGKATAVEISADEARVFVVDNGQGEFCVETLHLQAKAEKADIEGAGWQADHKTQEDSSDHHLHVPSKGSGLLAAHMDQLAARSEVVEKRKAIRRRLKAQEQAERLGLEPGDVVKHELPNRTHLRKHQRTQTSSQIFGRPAARRKAAASFGTHNCHVGPDGLMFRYIKGNTNTAVPARKRDRVRISAGAVL